MYSLAIQRKFAARHFLVGGDWGLKIVPTPINTVLK